MGYRELIKKVQRISGFSDKESKEALDHMVECLSVRLTAGERKDFASQLPRELQDIALTVPIPEEKPKKDIIADFMESQRVDEPRAKKQMLSAWKALKETISEGEIKDIKSQLPNATASMLY